MLTNDCITRKSPRQMAQIIFLSSLFIFPCSSFPRVASAETSTSIKAQVVSNLRWERQPQPEFAAVANVALKKISAGRCLTPSPQPCFKRLNVPPGPTRLPASLKHSNPCSKIHPFQSRTLQSLQFPAPEHTGTLNHC